MELKDKKVCVVGLGESGVWACKLLAKMGAQIKAFDQKPKSELEQQMKELEKLNVSFKFAGYELKDFDKCELVVLSPGVDENQPLFKSLAQKGIEIIGELELAWRFTTAPIIAVSGTNGKTTTVSLLGEIFHQAYAEKAWVGGNIGTPLSRLVVEEKKPEVIILEVSSFQLAQSKSFKPKIGVMLNLAQDHLDRHQNMQAYFNAKLKLFANQNKDEIAVLNANDPWVRKMEQHISSHILWFGDNLEDKAGAFFAGGQVIYRNSRREFSLSLKNWKLAGKHNLENLLASICCAGSWGVEKEQVQKVIDSFSPLEHRLEFVREFNGVKYYNDSKATNPHSVINAVLSFDEPIILLLGGRNKDNDFSELAELVKTKKVKVICFGEAGDDIKNQLEQKGVSAQRVDKMKEAFLLANRLAKPGWVVLLSPGCASFDEFKDYKERGKEFKKLVGELK